MAENNETPFSPLDPLGPEYGGINEPKLDELSYKPFEGDRIKMPEINFSASPVPSFNSINQPQLNIQNTITGIKPNKPGPQKGQSASDIASALNSYSKAISQANQDKNAYAKIYSYDAGPSGNNFYKRYAAYGQEKFDEIGFTPMRDNESLFNERTTKFDDFSRMMKHSFLPLVGQGFISGPKSLWKMAHGDFTSADLEDAKLYEEAAAIGQSTKGGVFAFVNNAAMNFGYTAGIISEIAAEELAALGITALTEGAATPLLAGVTERNIARLGIAVPRIAKYITKADDVFRGTVRALEASDTARAFYRAANTKVGRVLNPFSNTLEAMSTIRKAGEFDNITSLAKASKTFGGFYADVRNVNAAVSEARLEAGMVENKVYQNLYDEFYRRNGETPTNNQQYEMIKQSKQASLETLGWNTAIIYASNKITFDNILNPKGGISKILGNKTKEIMDLQAGKVFLKKTYEAGSKIAKGEFKYFENTIKGSLERMKEMGFKESIKDVAAQTAKKSLTYFKGNISEGLQENAQETIAQAMEKYHTDAFDSKAVRAHLYAKGASAMGMRDQSAYFADAWKEQNPLTAKGFETFATGFVMGAFAGPMNALPGWASTGYNRIFKPEEYADHKKKRDEYGKKVAKTLTDLYNDPKDFFDAKIFNLGNQELMAKIKQTGGRKEALDATDTSFVSQVYTALRSGSLNEFKDHLSSFKELTPEEFEGAMKGVPKGEGAKYQAKIDGVLTRADEIQKAYNEVTERYPNPIDLDQYEKGTDAYKKAAIFHSAWENAKMNAIFMNEGYKDSIKRIEQIKSFIRANKPLAKMTDSELQVLLQPERISNEKDLLKTEIESKRDTLPPAQIAKMETKLKALEDLEKAFDYYNRYEVIDREGHLEKLRANGIIKKTAEDQGISEDEAEANIRTYIDANLRVKQKSPENTLEAESKLEDAYKNYLKAIASVNGDIYLDKNAEEAFEMLLDSYKLGKESSILANHVNVLRSPKSFIEHVEKNYDWMKSLYENRKEYFDGLVNQELNNIELNALLNELADRNVYISADEAAEFQRTGKIPTEFFDNTRKAVIKPGHPEYNEYAELFERAAKVRVYNPSARAADTSALNLTLGKLNYEMQSEIDALPKTETTEELGKLDLGGKQSVSIKELQDQMEVGDYMDAEYLTGKNRRKQVTFFKSAEGLKYKNAKGDIVNVDKFSEKFVAGRRYKISLKPDPAEVSKIEKLYSEKRIEAINKLNDRAKTERLTLAARYIPFTTQTPIEELDKELRDELDNAFNNWVEDNDLTDEYETLTDGELYEEAENWIRTNKEAKVIIDRYNQRKIDQLIAEQLEDVEAPVMEINGEQIDFEDLTIAQIKSNIKKLERNLDKLNAKPEDELTDSDKEQKSLLEFNLTLANKYLNYKQNIKDTPKRAKVLKELQKMLEDQKDITRDDSVNKYVVKGNYLERVTRALQPFTKEYNYSRAADVEEVYNETLGSGKSVDEFIKELKKKKLPGFSKWTYDELEANLKILTGEVFVDTPLSQEEYTNFIDNGVVTPERVNSISRKIINNEKLTPRETEIFNDKTSDINSRIQEISSESTTDTKADIERRKKQSLSEKEWSTGPVKGAYLRQESDGRWSSMYFKPSTTGVDGEGVYRNTKEEVIAELEKMYNAELAALEQPTADTDAEADVERRKQQNIIAIAGSIRKINGTTDPQRIFTEINKINNALKDNESIKLGLEDQAFIDKELKELKDKGYTFKTKEGEVLNTGENIIVESESLLKPNEVTESEKILIQKELNKRKIAKQEYLDAGYTEEEATLESKLSPEDSIDIVTKDLQVTVLKDGVQEKAGKVSISIITIKDAELAALGETKTQTKPSRKVTFNEVLTLVMEKTYEDRRIAGIFLDQQIRNFLAGVQVDRNPELISDEAFDALFGPNTVLSNFKEKTDSGEFVIIPNNIKLFDLNSGIAGEIDLMMVDREGRVFIVDIKTGEESKWNKYNNEKSDYSKHDEYALQLTAYRNLLYNMYGIEASLAILPLQIKVDPETGKTLSVERAEGVLDPDKGTFKVDPNATPLDPNAKDQRTFQQKIDSIIPRISPSGKEVTEEVPTNEEQKQIEKEVAQLTADQKKSQDRNMLNLINRIELLRERQKNLDKDVSDINDTLKFVDAILNQSVKLNIGEIRSLIENVSALDKVTGQLIKSRIKLNKKGLRARELRAQLKREFAIAGDVVNRIKDLKVEKELLEAQVKDLNNQVDYYLNLLEDPTMTLFSKTEINNKIRKVTRKISTIERLIKTIQNAISKSVAYIKEYLKIWERTNTKLEKFKSETGYRPLAAEEIRNLINSVDAADQATLAEYPNLSREFNKLESEIIDIMDATDLVDEVKQQEETRLSELQAALGRYQNQLRYLNELLEPIAGDIEENKISDKETSGPKPTETTSKASENKKQTTDAVQRSKDDKVVSSFSLSSIADLSTAIEQPDQIRAEVKTILDDIESAETVQDVIDIVEDLSSFKPSEIKMINDAARTKIKSQEVEFKESVEEKINTATGAKYITIKPIEDVVVGSEIVVTKIDGNNITFAITNSNTEKTVKFDKLINSVMTPEEARTKTTTEQVEITPETKTKIAESKTAADNLTDTDIDNIIAEVRNQDLDNLEENLYKKEIC
jgi:hypothetical protein